MTYPEIFSVGDEFIILNKDKSETREHFLLRAHFIIRNINNGTLPALVNMSHLFLNNKILKNRYGKTIEDNLNSYDCFIA